MNDEIKTRWLTALRSGEYKQGKGGLHVPEGDTYCCLGVLCDLAFHDGVVADLGVHGSFTEYGSFTDPEDSDTAVLPQAVVEWAGLPSENPAVSVDRNGDRVSASLSELNDDYGWNFARIADHVEQL